MGSAEFNSALSISQKTLVLRHCSHGRAQQFSSPAHGSKEKSASFLKQETMAKSFISATCSLRHSNLGIVLNTSALQIFLGSQSHCTGTWNKHSASKN